jgi:RNA polymerase sigma factor (TIGR02999 family)
MNGAIGHPAAATGRRSWRRAFERRMLDAAMSDVTQILRQIEDGDPSAADQLLPLVYDELRKLAAARMAAESSDHTLQATALVHEAYVRLVDGPQAKRWNSRGHFFGAAAEAMRRILVEQARRRQSLKAGGALDRIELQDALAPEPQPALDLLDLDEALQRLEQEEPDKAQLVKLRFFAGLSLDDAARTLEISTATAKRHWVYARAWLYGQLKER